MATPSSKSNPLYITARSAETILSDFRPLKLQTDALICLNLFLDDILANIISFSRSILTDRLKTGLLKAISTTIGKDALLEAEMELRAYWQRPNAIKPSPAQVSASEYNFSLPSMIELMRLKCEAYSTLNDSDEDAQAENRIQERLRTQGIEPPKSVIVAPAALYLTAILECICEHILSSVGRVATRDSSKEVAGTHDLFVALCEDDAIYPVFRASKIYGHIEVASKQSSKPRRSKSLSRSERHERDVSLSDSLPHPRRPPSTESGTSAAVSGSVGSDPRNSLDKGKGNKSFRYSGDRDAPLSSDSVSRMTTSRKGLGAQNDSANDSATVVAEEGSLTQEFDNLVRSGDTMKVSLTPDRLRTMETAKEQQQSTVTSAHSRTLSAADANGRPSVTSDLKFHGTRKPHVDSITEDEEPKETVVSPQAAAQSLDVRPRSVSTSGISQGINPRLTVKSHHPRSPPPSAGSPGRDTYNRLKSLPATPQRVRKIQRNLEAMDIDDVMNGSEEGSESSPDVGDQPTQGRPRLYPVSKVTKDLISFLEEGPPPQLQPVRPASVSTVSLTPTTKSAKGGSRLQRMMSKLSLSREDRMLQDSQHVRGVGVMSAPSTLGSNRPSPLPFAVKPTPPPVLSIPPPVQISQPPSAQTSPDDDIRPHMSRGDRPRKMSVRKAVPAWEETGNQGVSAPHIKATKMTSPPRLAPTKASPAPASTFTRPTEVKDTNGYTHDNPKPPQSDSPAAMNASTDSIEARSRSPPENGNGKVDQPGLSRPRSSRPSRRSSVNDEQLNSVRRSSGRRTQLSNGTVDHAQAITVTPSLSEALALDMRSLMVHASTADECRLLVDTFLTRAGITLPFAPPELEPTPSDVEPLEQSLVHHFLGVDPDEPQLQPNSPVPVEPVRSSLQTTHEYPQESKGLQQITAAPMDSASAVHTHHVNTAVAVVS